MMSRVFYTSFLLLGLSQLVLCKASEFVQLGNDLVGEAAGDQSGYSVSLSSNGTRVAIGAPTNRGNDAQNGHTRVYEYISGGVEEWTQVGSDINGESIGGLSGYSVSLSSDGMRLAVGAPQNNGSWRQSGHTRVYEYDGDEWTQLGSDINGEALEDYSGWWVSLAADGMSVAIGAVFNDGMNGTDSGHTRVYNFNGDDWIQMGSDIDGEAAGDNSGFSLSLSADGTKVAIGVRRNDGNGEFSGHTRVYIYNGDEWIQMGWDIDGEAAEDISGSSVSLSADGMKVAIGAPGNDGNGTKSGHTRVYEYSGGDEWVQMGSDIEGETAGDQSGRPVSLSADGTRVAIGAPGNDGNGTSSGHTRVYEYNGDDWIRLGGDIDGANAGDRSGSSVSLSGDGSTVAFGAPQNDGNGTSSGQTRIFNLQVLQTSSPTPFSTQSPTPSSTPLPTTLSPLPSSTLSPMSSLIRPATPQPSMASSAVLFSSAVSRWTMGALILVDIILEFVM